MAMGDGGFLRPFSWSRLRRSVHRTNYPLRAWMSSLTNLFMYVEPDATCHLEKNNLYICSSHTGGLASVFSPSLLSLNSAVPRRWPDRRQEALDMRTLPYARIPPSLDSWAGGWESSHLSLTNQSSLSY